VHSIWRSSRFVIPRMEFWSSVPATWNSAAFERRSKARFLIAGFRVASEGMYFCRITAYGRNAFRWSQIVQTRRRDVLKTTTCIVALVGAGVVTWPFVASLNPSSDIEQPQDFDLRSIKEGEIRYVKIDSSIFIIRHRSRLEAAATQGVPIDQFSDQLARNTNLPKTALASVENRSVSFSPAHVFMSVQCPHEGCILFQEPEQEWRWSCPCCGSRFDAIGRWIQGLTGENLPIPTYIEVRSMVLRPSVNQPLVDFDVQQ
jgi:ubiquinol-cytochrome c reductase iron-sulfur subunit